MKGELLSELRHELITSRVAQFEITKRLHADEVQSLRETLRAQRSMQEEHAVEVDTLNTEKDALRSHLSSREPEEQNVGTISDARTNLLDKLFSSENQEGEFTIMNECMFHQIHWGLLKHKFYRKWGKDWSENDQRPGLVFVCICNTTKCDPRELMKLPKSAPISPYVIHAHGVMLDFCEQHVGNWANVRTECQFWHGAPPPRMACILAHPCPHPTLQTCSCLAKRTSSS